MNLEQPYMLRTHNNKLKGKSIAFNNSKRMNQSLFSAPTTKEQPLNVGQYIADMRQFHKPPTGGHTAAKISYHANANSVMMPEINLS